VSQAERHRLQASRQLLQLRELRERAAYRAWHQARQAHEAASQAVQARQGVIAKLRSQRHALAQTIVDAQAERLPRHVPYADARREQLDDLIERAEYGLIDDEDDLCAAQRRLDEADRARRRASGQVQAVASMVDEARLQLRQCQERQQESIDQELACGRRRTQDVLVVRGGSA
jgi:hypothetical protein